MPELQPAKFKPEALAKGMKERVGEWDRSLRQFVQDFQAKISNLPQTNYDLGLEFAKRGEVKDAIFRFKVALYFAPNFTGAWYNLGCCLLAKGEREKAKEAFKKTLRLDPTHTDAKYMISTIDPNILPVQDRPIRMPSHMVEGTFARIAPQYEFIQAGEGYEGHVNLFKGMRAIIGRGDLRILDIGCGVGLSSLPWRKESKSIVGVDVTPEMVMVARETKVDGFPVFAQLYALDANSPHFAVPDAPFDLVIALNVLPWVGEASAFMTNAAKAVQTGGYFAVSHDVYTGQGFSVMPSTSRFGHSVEYLRQLGTAAGLTPLQQEVITLYPDQKASLLIFTKKASA